MTIKTAPVTFRVNCVMDRTQHSLEKKLARVRKICDENNFFFFLETKQFEMKRPCRKQHGKFEVVSYFVNEIFLDNRLVELSENNKLVAVISSIVDGEDPNNGNRIITKILDNYSGNILHFANKSHVLTCNHCRKAIFRKNYYAILDVASGNLFTVGGNCSDYYIPKFYLDILKHLSELKEYEENPEDFISDGDEEQNGKHVQSVYDAECLAVKMAKWFTVMPYISIKKASFDNSMSSKAQFFTYEMLCARGKSNLNDSQKEMMTFIEDNLAKVTKEFNYEHIREHLLNLFESQSNEFESNMFATFDSDIVSNRTLGFFLYGVSRYVDDMNSAAQKANDPARVNEFVGQIGKRMDFGPGKVTFVKMIDSQYGSKILIKILLNSGHSLTWFCTTDLEVQSGMEFKNIKATVKKHDIYKGEKSTMINRAVVD